MSVQGAKGFGWTNREKRSQAIRDGIPIRLPTQWEDPASRNIEESAIFLKKWNLLTLERWKSQSEQYFRYIQSQNNYSSKKNVNRTFK